MNPDSRDFIKGKPFVTTHALTFSIRAAVAVTLLAPVFLQPLHARQESAPPPQTQTAPAPPQPPAAPERAVPSPEPPSPPPAAPLPSDEEICARIGEALERDAAISGHGTFKAKCEEGIVTLSGKGETLSVLKQAERRAGDVLGVLDVVVLASISTAGAPDPKILLEIQQALDVPAFRGDDIAVAVMEGRVHLNGTTTTYARKLLAERSASEVPGVISAQNNLRVVAPPEGNDTELARRIRLLLTGGLTPVPGNFEVTVKDRQAVLRGKVPLYSHRLQAERLALSVGGIVSVQNRLKVDPTLFPARPTVEVTP
jgi:osmotically-inducible protein OsmY